MATIKDVANEAGVSIATVSRILNQTGWGSAATRARVMEASKKLGYQPNSLARSMVKGKAGTIALVIPDVRNPFFTDAARGVEDVANKYDYRVMLCNTDENLDKQRKYLEALRSKIVDGFIISVASEEDRELKKIVRDNIPFVFIDRICPSIPADAIVVDNRNGSFKAVSHLLGLGHRHIALIAGKRDTLPGRERLQGYLDAHAQAGLEADERFIRDGGFTTDGGFQAMAALLSLADRPTAVFVSNNTMTIGCLRALAQAKIKIPEQMAVVGFDDSDWAEFFSPPLTVIRQPTYTMGTLAGEILFQRIRSAVPDERKEIVLKPELVIRESCGALKNGTPLKGTPSTVF
ncbi:MAG: LacI family DNA-binding transcriptional regulator [Patescibacteria group bacterium]